MSLPEVLLWQRLKGSPQGVAVRKQHPVSGYRADFYCAAARLVIEIDGIAHDMGDRPERDIERTARLGRAGYRVLRITAADVLRNADEAAQSIVAFAAAPPPPPASLAVPSIGLTMPRIVKDRPGDDPTRCSVNGEDL